jgi:hypothetical protein
VTDQFVQDALDPWTFVAQRTLPGGPAPLSTRKSLADARELLGTDRELLAADRANLQEADEHRAARIASLTA